MACYAILQDCWSGARRETSSEAARDFTKAFRGLEESALERLGVSVIRIGHFEEIPAILARIRG